LNLAVLLEYFTVTSSIFQSQLILDALTTICIAQLHLAQCKDLMLSAFSMYCKDLTPIAVCWNIYVAHRNKFNRRRTADRARADRAGEATQQLLLRPRQSFSVQNILITVPIHPKP
jgi:hypothetical protein